MDRMSLGERLRSLREARDIGVRELGRLTGINHATLSQAENGKRWVGKLPSYEDLSALARVFGITVDELVDPHVADARASFLTEPVGALLDRLGAEPTGDEIEFDMTASAGTGKKQPKSNRIKVRKPHYLIEVEGDCMVPEIESGDTVRFDPTLDPEDGDWVVATVDGERAIVKKLVIKGGIMQQLLPLNGEPLVIDENVRIVGVVISYERPGPRGRRKRAS